MSSDNQPFTDQQISEFRQHFKNHDFKHMGAVQREDLGNLLRACGQVPTEGWIKERMKIKLAGTNKHQFFKPRFCYLGMRTLHQEEVADPDGRGFVEWDGFMKLVNQATVRGNPDDELLEAFRTFDKGLTGKIKSSELRRIVTSLGDVLTEEEVEELIRDADPLCEGVVNYEALTRTLVYGPN